MVPAKGAVYAVAGNQVLCLATGDGRKKWATLVQSNGTLGLSLATVADDTVYVGGDNRLLHALDAKDGSLVWSFEAGSTG